MFVRSRKCIEPRCLRQGTVFLKQQKLAAFDSSLRKAFAERIASKSVLNITLIPIIKIFHALNNRDASLATF